MAISGATPHTTPSAADVFSKATSTALVTVAAGNSVVFSTPNAVLSTIRPSSSLTTAETKSSTLTGGFPEQNVLIEIPNSPSGPATVVESLASASDSVLSGENETSSAPDPQIPMEVAEFAGQTLQEPSTSASNTLPTASSTSQDVPLAAQTAWSSASSLLSSLSNPVILTDPVTSQAYSSSSTTLPTNHYGQGHTEAFSLIRSTVAVTVDGHNSFSSSPFTTPASFLASPASVTTQPQESQGVNGQSSSTPSMNPVPPTDSRISSRPTSDSHFAESPTENQSHRTTALAAGMSVGCLVLLGVIVSLFIYKRKRNKTRFKDVRDGTSAPLSSSGSNKEATVAFPKATLTSPSATDDPREISKSPWSLPTDGMDRSEVGVSRRPPAIRLFDDRRGKPRRQDVLPEMQEVAGGHISPTNYADISTPSDSTPGLASRDSGCRRSSFLSLDFPMPPLAQHQPPLSPFEHHPMRACLPSEGSSNEVDERMHRGRSDQFDLEKIASPVAVVAPLPLFESEKTPEGSDRSLTPVSLTGSWTEFEDTRPQQENDSGARSDLRVGAGGSSSSMDSEVLGFLGGYAR